LLSNTYEIVKSAKVKSLNAKNEKKNISGLATKAKCQYFSVRPFDDKINFDLK
jgi:hypothetical protein